MISVTGKSVITVTLVSAAILGLVSWRLHTRPETRVTNAVIVADASGSVADKPEAIVGLAERFLAQPNLARESTLTVLTTGDGETANEPRLVEKYEVPYSKRAMDGKRAIEGRKQELLADLRNRIVTTPRTTRSPILLAIRRAVEDLRAGGCRADDECYLIVRTDGMELSERSLKDSIHGSGKTKPLANPVSNEGIRVAFCGLSEVNVDDKVDRRERTPLRTAVSAERLRDVWRSVFTVPDTVSFEPYCPRTESARTAGQ